MINTPKKMATAQNILLRLISDFTGSSPDEKLSCDPVTASRGAAKDI